MHLAEARMQNDICEGSRLSAIFYRTDRSCGVRILQGCRMA